MKTIKVNNHMAKHGIHNDAPFFALSKSQYFYDMPTITVRIPENAQTQLTEFVKQVGGEVVSVKAGKSERPLNKAEADLYRQLKSSLKEADLYRQGKIGLQDAQDLLNEL